VMGGRTNIFLHIFPSPAPLALRNGSYLSALHSKHRKATIRVRVWPCDGGRANFFLYIAPIHCSAGASQRIPFESTWMVLYTNPQEGAEPHSQDRRDMLSLVNKTCKLQSGSGFGLVMGGDHAFFYISIHPLLRWRFATDRAWVYTDNTVLECSCGRTSSPIQV